MKRVPANAESRSGCSERPCKLVLRAMGVRRPRQSEICNLKSAISLLFALLLLAPALRAAEWNDAEVLKILTTEQPRDRAIRRGLDFLRKQQKPDGAVGDQYPVALSSLALMAHFAAGHVLDDQEHGPWLKRALNLVIVRQDESGYFGRADGSNMYGHGIATLMLAEAMGLARDDEIEDRIRSALERALRVTVGAAQVKKQPGHEGGWRYQPNADDSDLSLSGWQLMGLHATQQVGITVPEGLIKAAVDYAKGLTTPDGSVGYQRLGEDKPALRGLALLCIAIGGQEKDSNLKAIVSRIESDPIQWHGDRFFYRAYYDAVGLSRAARDSWERYAPRLESVIIEHQNDDGSWNSPGGGEDQNAGVVYRTSMAVLALAVDRHVLPAYQR